MKLLLALAALTGTGCTASSEYRVYFGTYTRGESKGIYMSDFDSKTGALSEPRLVAETKNPSFLEIHPNGKFLYSVGEVPSVDGKPGGGVNAYAIDSKTGDLKLLSAQSSKGGGPCHVTVDPSGKCVMVANYGGGSVAAYQVGGDGKISPATSFIQHEGSSVDPRRQKGPHAHSINVDPGNRFAFAADLGLDKVLIYKLDAAAGKLTSHGFAKVAPGAGPRHFAFHPSGKFAYVINEMTRTVTAFAFDAPKGTLTEVQTITTVPGDVKDGSTAEVRVSPDGRFLYGSNRGHDSIASFTINKETGKLTPTGFTPTGGKTPRNFNLDPTGKWLLAANQNSASVVVFKIDPATGVPKPTGAKVKVDTPVCVRFVEK